MYVKINFIITNILSGSNLNFLLENCKKIQIKAALFSSNVPLISEDCKLIGLWQQRVYGR